jgi:hypothetical protein
MTSGADADHMLEMCSRAIRRLHEIAKLDPIPNALVRGEADVLEKWIVELKLHAASGTLKVD